MLGLELEDRDKEAGTGSILLNAGYPSSPGLRAWPRVRVSEWLSLKGCWKGWHSLRALCVPLPCLRHMLYLRCTAPCGKQAVRVVGPELGSQGCGREPMLFATRPPALLTQICQGRAGQQPPETTCVKPKQNVDRQAGSGIGTRLGL